MNTYIYIYIYILHILHTYIYTGKQLTPNRRSLHAERDRYQLFRRQIQRSQPDDHEARNPSTHRVHVSAIWSDIQSQHRSSGRHHRVLAVRTLQDGTDV